MLTNLIMCTLFFLLGYLGYCKNVQNVPEHLLTVTLFTNKELIEGYMNWALVSI